MSKKKPGSELKDTVAGLLKARFSEVQTEKRLATTTADVFYVDDSNPYFPLKIAIECKDWQSPLQSGDIAKISMLYAASFKECEIDRLLIVSRHELGMQPSDSISKLSNTRHLSFHEFVGSIMNFQLLLQENIAAFANHESSKFYIHPRQAHKKEQLSNAVYDWILAQKCPAAMVYGGYGLGKTSFSYYLASSLSKQYRNGEFSRIPIRIPLGGLFTKQDLKALICSELTGAEGQPAVGNFSYNVFIQMVRKGFILLILDGFDEMRHAMSIEDFQYTFEQMSKLFEDQSKVIILGRPDAFFDNDEEQKVLTALLSTTEVDSNSIKTFEVDKFNREEIDSYLANYFETRDVNTEDRTVIQNLKDSEYEVLSRPVQLNMFTKLLGYYIQSKKTITRYELYWQFVTRFVKREDEKPSRKIEHQKSHIVTGFSDTRSVFMQNLAWWILTEKRDNRFVASEIPQRILPKEIRSKKHGMREALIGSIVEHSKESNNIEFKSGDTLIGKKGANYFYFPHKSYIEFFVQPIFL